MTDKEIIEHLATDFMGWQFTDDTQTIGEHSLEGVKDTVWFRRDSGSIGVAGAVTCQNFDPLHDLAACALVLDEIERQEFSWEWGYYDWGDHLDYIFRLWDENGAEGEGISDARYRAVCLAALEAVSKG